MMMQRTFSLCCASSSACGQFAQQLLVQRIQRVGTVQRDKGDVVFDFDDDRLIGHERLLSLVSVQT